MYVQILEFSSRERWELMYCIASIHTYQMMPVSTDDMDYNGESGAGYNRGAESKGSHSYHFTQQQLSSQQVKRVNFQDVCQWVESKCFANRTIKLCGLFTLAVIWT